MTAFECYRNREPGWLLREIREKWRNDIDKWTRNLSRGLYERDEAMLAGCAIRKTFQLLECTRRRMRCEPHGRITTAMNTKASIRPTQPAT
jgi:hypothetical protein